MKLMVLKKDEEQDKKQEGVTRERPESNRNSPGSGRSSALPS